MRIELIVVPYDSGRRGERMGAGPERLLEAGLADDLRAAGCTVDVHTVELQDGTWPGEVQSAFRLAGGIAARIRHATSRGAFPLILSGNCAPAALGAIAALGGSRVYWFDAHADFNTPETTTSGFFDGMSLAVATGRCWRGVARNVAGFAPVPEDAVVLIGARAIDALELGSLRDSSVIWVRPEEVRHGLDGILEGMPPAAAGATSAYVHVDLDVLDPSEGRANGYAAEGGLMLGDVEWCIEAIARTSHIAAAALTAYDPDTEPGGRTSANARRLALQLARCAA
jgi:arginase